MDVARCLGNGRAIGGEDLSSLLVGYQVIVVGFDQGVNSVAV